MVTPVHSTASRPVNPPPAPEDVFRSLDTGGKGYLTVSDIASAVVSISPQGARLSQADADAQAQQAVAKMDTDQNGRVSLDEFKAEAPPADAAKSPGQRPAGRPPGGPGGPGGAGGGTGANSSTSYDPADTNQDGTVSEMERLAYTVKHASGTATTARKSVADVAVKAYEDAQSGVR